MKRKEFNISTFLLLFLTLVKLQSQEAVLSSGSSATGTGGSVSFSVGQLVYTTIIGTGGSISQGVQQPYDIAVISGLDEAKGISLQCIAYPNPTTDQLILKIENSYQLSFVVSLFDMSGKLIVNQKISGTETAISMGNLASATYILKVTQNDNEVKTFKIIKN
jgi:hypothetical protein